MKDMILKFKFKDKATVISAPENFTADIMDLGFKTAFDKKIKSANTLVFLENKKDFIHFLTKQMKSVEHDGVLWFAYTKGSSKIKTDINRDILWEVAKDYGIRPVSAISIDATWSALRFRPMDLVKSK